MDLPDPPDAEIERLVADMNTAGYAIVRGYTELHVAAARRFVEGQLQRHGHEYFSLPGAELVRGSVLEEIGQAPAFRGLLRRICDRIAPMPADEAVYQVLRVLKGRSGVGQALLFHYDAYLVTALMPIAIPAGSHELRGDLILYPRLRRVRRTAFANMVEKALLQNALARRFMATTWAQRRFGAVRLVMEPGNLYLFWGYQSLHGNEACLPQSLRATALFHFGDPHRHSLMARGVQRLRFWREARRRDAGGLRGA